MQGEHGRGTAESISDTNTISENKCKSSAEPDKQTDMNIDSQEVLKEEWHIDEFSLGAVYLHRIYKCLFH